MKKSIIITVIFLFLGIPLFAQNLGNLDGFNGIPWGASMKNAKTIMESKDFTLRHETEKAYAFTGKFAGENVEVIILYFFEDKMYMAVVSYKPEENLAKRKYKKYVDMMTQKYGKPHESVENYIWPYSKGDEFEETAISVNKAIIFSDWVFNNDFNITITISNDLNTLIYYQNNKLSKEADEFEKAQNINDL